MPTFKTTVELEVEVEYEVEPAQKGRCNSMGVPEEESWDAYPYVTSVSTPKFKDWEDDDKEHIIQECQEDMEEE